MARTSKRPGSSVMFPEMNQDLSTAPCVPAIRAAVETWRARGYRGATETTRELLNHWFHSDHRLPDGALFRYHYFQREAIETLIYLWEIERVHYRKHLLERYAYNPNLRLPVHDDFARYAVKMATGSGKTKVMSLAVAWQYFNAAREEGPEYAKTFLVIAPNVIVFDRLRTDLGGGDIFRTDPVIPTHMQAEWEVDCVMRGEGERAPTDGLLFCTNIQQLYPPRTKKSANEETDEMFAVLGAKPQPSQGEAAAFTQRIAAREGALMVINDEAHHTHDEDSEWNKVIRNLHAARPLAAQLDFSATPRFAKGGLFPWTVYDYPLKRAMFDYVVKRPIKGVADIEEVTSDVATIRYAGFLVAGVNRWIEYRDQLAPLGKKPLLFIMMNTTDEANVVGDWLRAKYPTEFGADRTLVIHTNKQGEITDKDLDKARTLARQVDNPNQPVNAIVSVLMLREGWDVQNVTVVVGLRPYTATAAILPEQTIGRGLRLMFRGEGNLYQERVDIIGNKGFLKFVDDLEKTENVTLDTDDLKTPLKIVAIAPDTDRSAYDIGIPQLSPALMRKRTLAEEIAALDVHSLTAPPLPLRPGETTESTFRYEGKDILTLETTVDRMYQIPDPQTSGEVIGYYANIIAANVKLPSQFAYIAPKVREFFETRAFGRRVDLEDPSVIKAMGRSAAAFVVCTTFEKALREVVIEQGEPTLLAPKRMLSQCPPFPYSRTTYPAKKSIFNLTPCDNQFERAFAEFLDNAPDVAALAKLPIQFRFAIEYTDEASNMRYYYPDFVTRLSDGEHWLLETKGQEDVKVAHKDRAATLWCENPTRLSGKTWRYLKIAQTQFERLQPADFADLTVLEVFNRQPPAPATTDRMIADLVAQGESHTLEFKSSARWGMRDDPRHKKGEDIVVKTVAAFLNSDEGGTLLLGVADDGTMLGLADDYQTLREKPNRDGYDQFLTNLLIKAFGRERGPFIRITFHTLGGKDVCRIAVQPSPTPVWVQFDKVEQFYVRMNATSQPLTPREAMDYSRHRWK